jgi:hypothetical protein
MYVLFGKTNVPPHLISMYLQSLGIICSVHVAKFDIICYDIMLCRASKVARQEMSMKFNWPLGLAALLKDGEK